jgi:hypothetical protein
VEYNGDRETSTTSAPRGAWYRFSLCFSGIFSVLSREGTGASLVEYNGDGETRLLTPQNLMNHMMRLLTPRSN